MHRRTPLRSAAATAPVVDMPCPHAPVLAFGGAVSGPDVRLRRGEALAPDGPRAIVLALPQTAGAAQLMQIASAHGAAALDHSALVRALEIMADHELDGD